MQAGSNHWLGFALAGTIFGWSPMIGAQDYQATERLFFKGDYPACLEACEALSPMQPEFAALEIRTLLETGKYENAVSRGMALWHRSPFDPELALALADALKVTGQASQARNTIRQAVRLQPDPPAPGQSRKSVPYGGLFLREGADAMEVL